MTFNLTGPDHWRYRYARRVWRPLPFLLINTAFVVSFLTAAALDNYLILLGTILLAAPIVLPLRLLGCWRCNYQLVRPYRGADFPEHGDSYFTGYYRFTRYFPSQCPKCGACILSDGTAPEERPADA